MAIGDFVSEDQYSFVVEGPEGYQTIAKTPSTVRQMESLKAAGATSGQFAAPPAPVRSDVSAGVLPANLQPQTVSPLLPVDQRPTVDQADFNPAMPVAQQPQGGMGGFVPVQMQVQAPGSSTTTERKTISADAKKALEDSYKAQAQAVESAKILELEAAKREAEIYGAMQGEYEASFNRQNEAMAQKRSAYDAARGKFEDTVKAFTEAKIKDPVAEQSFAQKLGAAIAVGLGAYASAKTGGPNAALQILNSSIERQVQLYKMDIEKKGAEVNLRRNDLAMLKEELGDISQAEAAFRSALLSKAEVQTKIAAAKSKSPIIQAKADQLNAGIAAEKAKIMADYESGVVRNIEQAGGASVAYGPSMGLSSADLKKASKEVTEFDIAYKTILRSFDKAAKTGFAGAWPSVLGGQAGEKGAEQATLSAAVVQKVPGIRSDADYIRIIVPMLPSPTDPARTIKAKKEALENFFMGSAPESWLKLQNINKSPSRTFQPN